MTKRKTTIIDVIRHRQLFGSLPAFQDLSTWSSWLVWLKAVFALPMDSAELEIYRECTGRSDPPKTEPSEVYTLCGRRSGKSFLSALVAVFSACFKQYRPRLNAGETAIILVMARDRPQARIILNYIRGILHGIPPLNQLILAERSDEIELDGNVTILVKTSDFRSIRGLSLALVICDELCFWDSAGISPDREVFAAIRPALATLNGRIFAVSTPYSEMGMMYEQHKAHYGKENGHALIWRAATSRMNPTVSPELIAREIEADPENAKAEWLAEFRTDLSAAFSPESIAACVIPGRDELLPSKLIAYRAFTDPSGGRSDAFTVAVGHRDATTGKAVIDYLRAWHPPFDPSLVVGEVSEILKRYGVVSVEGDNYGGEWPVEQFKRHGIHYERETRSKSELYLALIPAVNSGGIELPDNAQLINELRRLERRRGRAGKDLLDHPAYGGHDDLANSVAGACWQIFNDEKQGAVNARRFLVEGAFG